MYIILNYTSTGKVLSDGVSLHYAMYNFFFLSAVYYPFTKYSTIENRIDFADQNTIFFSKFTKTI